MQLTLVQLAIFYIEFTQRTSRIHLHMADDSRPIITNGTPAIYAFWHGQLLMMPFGWPHRHKAMPKMYVLISSHRDGHLISRISRHFGLDTIAGSSNRNPTTAIRTCLKRLKQGDSITITPDGPRGPRHSIAPGILAMAQLSGFPIIPWSNASTRAHHMKSWDKFQVTHPFSDVHIVAGPPLYIAPETDLETAAAQLASAMQHVTHQAEQCCGQPRIAA